MSYDLQVWSVERPPIPRCLGDLADWRERGGTWAYERPQWQIVVGPSDRVLPEDIPDEVAQSLPGIAVRTELNLSPISAGATARKLLRRTALALAKAGHGIVVDPQQETFATPSGVKRLLSLGADENAAVLALGWWFGDGPQIAAAGFGEMVDLLAAALPEAIPRRYGLSEPPQHLYAETGRDHFVAFLAQHARGLGMVWYPRPPVADVSLSIPDRIGGSRQGYRSGRFEITIDIQALTQPGWSLAVQRAWRRISHLLRPFYGDVRTLRGFVRRRGRYWGTARTEQHPVRAWWWAGVPHGPVHATVVGEPCLSLWSSFRKAADHDRGLAFVSTPDWTRADNAFQLTGEPPAEIAQPASGSGNLNADRVYPPVWPFGPPIIV
jgi:hypothetical protein